MQVRISNPLNPPASATAYIRKHDSRCRGWSKIIRAADDLPEPENVSGANDIKSPYLDQNASDKSIELFPGDVVLFGEARHHRKNYGWFYQAGFYSVSGEVCWIEPTAGIKSMIKVALDKKTRAGHGKFGWMMRGAGDVAAMIRMAHAVRKGIELFEDFVEVQVEPSTDPDLEVLFLD